MIEEILGYKFTNAKLLQEALSHPSICVKTSISSINYERLEFLGDVVLSLVISEILFNKYPDENEGDLAKRRSSLVSGEIISEIAHKIGLGDKILMTEAEEKLGGRDNHNNLENVLEAVIGSIYLDSGLNNIKNIIKSLWQDYIDNMIEVPIDPKSKLQEILQKHGKKLPKYELLESYGPKHMLTFRICLKADGFEEIIGEGRTKQQAEKKAAMLLLDKIKH